MIMKSKAILFITFATVSLMYSSSAQTLVSQCGWCGSFGRAALDAAWSAHALDEMRATIKDICWDRRANFASPISCDVNVDSWWLTMGQAIRDFSRLLPDACLNIGQCTDNGTDVDADLDQFGSDECHSLLSDLSMALSTVDSIENIVNHLNGIAFCYNLDRDAEFEPEDCEQYVSIFIPKVLPTLFSWLAQEGNQEDICSKIFGL